ncbi:CHAT domain-containing protein [Micromonospora sp. NPDC006766]|uniref:CHAT domain-containing protein n=1 Tax=Micromonospora sp. NPDC006766 TaxID=3154778 RepID=UPI0033E85B65
MPARRRGHPRLRHPARRPLGRSAGLPGQLRDRKPRPGPARPDLRPARRFLHAGAAAVVAPLLSVSEDASAVMAARFYHELTAGGGPHEALARAQKWLAGAGTGDQCAFLDEVIAAAESADYPATGLRYLVTAIRENPERHAELTGEWAWSLFTLSI